MQTDVLPFLPFNVNPDFSLESLFFVGIGNALFYWNNVGRTVHYVVARAWRHTLGKFAAMIGDDIPMGALFPDWIYLHFDAIQWVVVRAISSAKDKAVILYELLVFISV
jgi:hypothetical protein